jgi:hypothetical protein
MEDKNHDTKDKFYEKSRYHHLRKYHSITLLGDFNSNFGRRIFSNRQLGMKVSMSKLMIME